MAEHSTIQTTRGGLVARMLQEEAQKRASPASATLSAVPQPLDLTAWYQEHVDLLHQFLYLGIKAVAGMADKRNAKMIQSMGDTHAALKKQADLIAGDAIPTVVSRDGHYAISYDRLAVAQAKVRVLTAELGHLREELAAAKSGGTKS